MNHRFSRREFYDLVWSKPMTHVAKELGVSDVALHKVCRKHGIPNPPAGWWAKKAAGKRADQIALPETKQGQSLTIMIRSAPAGSWSAAATGFAQKIASAADGTARPAARRPSVIVRDTLAALRRTKPNAQGLVSISDPGHVRCCVAKGSIDRVANILPQLETIAGILGFHLTLDDRPTRFSNGAQTVTFEIMEGYSRKKHVMTRKEEAERAAWQKRSNTRNWLHSHSDPYPYFADWDYTPTGVLSITLENVWSRHHATPRRSFNDGKLQRVEEMSEKIILGVVVIAAAKAALQIEADERERVLRVEQRRREIEEARRRIEERRNAELGELIALQERLGQLENVMRLVDGTSDGSTHTGIFMSWLGGRLDEVRAQLTPEGLEERFVLRQLFGPDDYLNIEEE